MKILVKYVLFFLIVGYFFNSDFFERNFYLNELFSLLGFVFFLAFISLSKNLKINLKSYHFLILLFCLICVFHLVISIPKKTNWYYYARNSVIFYSIFSYFIGFYFFTTFDAIFKKTQEYIKYYISIAFLFLNPLLARYSGPVLFVTAFKKINYKTFFILFILIFIHGFIYDALSIIVLAPMLILIMWLPNYKSFLYLSILATVCIASFIIYFEDNFLLYKIGDYRYFGNVRRVYDSNVLLSIDDNTIWRLILWYRYIVERFPENLFGIGFGTPLLPYVPKIQTTHHGLDEVHAHVSGAHNSFITFYVRLGIVGLLVILEICKKAFKDFYALKFKNPDHEYIKYYIIWFSIFTIGLFNLSLESPLRASIFWISLGFLSKIKILMTPKNMIKD